MTGADGPEGTVPATHEAGLGGKCPGGDALLRVLNFRLQLRQVRIAARGVQQFLPGDVVQRNRLRLQAQLAAATGGRGVDVVLDMVGGSYLQRNVDVLATDGRLVMIGRQGGARSELDVMPILRKRLTLTGSTLRARTVAEKGAIAAAVHREVWPLVEAGAVSVIVHETFPLARAADAHRMMESSAHIGKLVLLEIGRAHV